MLIQRELPMRNGGRMPCLVVEHLPYFSRDRAKLRRVGGGLFRVFRVFRGLMRLLLTTKDTKDTKKKLLELDRLLDGVVFERDSSFGLPHVVVSEDDLFGRRSLQVDEPPAAFGGARIVNHSIG